MADEEDFSTQNEDLERYLKTFHLDSSTSEGKELTTVGQFTKGDLLEAFNDFRERPDLNAIEKVIDEHLVRERNWRLGW